MMEKILFLIKEGFRNTWRHKMTSITAIISLFISLYIVGILSIVGNNTYKMLHYLRSKYKIEVFFKQDVSNEQAIGLIHRIKSIDGVRTATIIEKEDAVRIFKDQFGENIVELLGYNPLPVSAVINIERYRKDFLKVEPIIKEIRKIPSVEEIRYQGNLINKIEKNYKKIIDLLPYVSGIIVIISILVIYNTIRLSIYSRRELFQTLRLIGASKTFIKAPFIFEGLLLGLIATVLVFPMIFITIQGSNYLLYNFTSLTIMVSYDPLIIIWILILSTFISIFGSYRAAASFLK